METSLLTAFGCKSQRHQQAAHGSRDGFSAVQPISSFVLLKNIMLAQEVVANAVKKKR
jgi:hypothetical protein